MQDFSSKNILITGGIATELLGGNLPSLLEITHPDMTRFSMEAEECAAYILSRIVSAVGGEIFIPKMKAYRLVDLVKTMAPASEVRYTSPRFTEKIHEVLFSEEEARNGRERTNEFIISMDERSQAHYEKQPDTWPISFKNYSSDSVPRISRSELTKLVATLQH